MKLPFMVLRERLNVFRLLRWGFTRSYGPVVSLRNIPNVREVKRRKFSFGVPGEIIPRPEALKHGGK